MKIVDVPPPLTFGEPLRGIPVPAPFQLGNEIRVTKVRVGVAMTREAPTHAEWFHLPDAVHRVDTAVAVDTSHAAAHMRGVIEVRVVRKIMNSHPLHREAGAVTLPQRFEQLALWMNLRVTIHACLGWWNGCFRCDFNRVMAVATVDAELPCVYRVAERDGLHWLVADIGRLWTETEGNEKRDVQRRSHTEDNRCRQQQIGPPRKNEVISTHASTDFVDFVDFVKRITKSSDQVS